LHFKRQLAFNKVEGDKSKGKKKYFQGEGKVEKYLPKDVIKAKKLNSIPKRMG